MDVTATRVNQLLTPLRKSIIDKPPYVSGTLQLPASSLSLFYKTTKDDHAARFAVYWFLVHPGGPPLLTCHHRYIDLVHASFNELEQLAQACEPTAFGVYDDHGSSGEMDVGRFAPMLAPDHTILGKLIKDYHFEGSQNKLTIELLKLNVYGTNFIST